jgi:hypothetical protein
MYLCRSTERKIQQLSVITEDFTLLIQHIYNIFITELIFILGKLTRQNVSKLAVKSRETLT